MLAVEVLELSEDHALVFRLAAESLRLGVREVWLVDPVDETVTIHTPTEQSCYSVGRLTATLSPDWPPFQCRAEQFFE